MARALKLVVAALKAERAVILRPPTVARIVWAKRPPRVTHNVARVQHSLMRKGVFNVAMCM